MFDVSSNVSQEIQGMESKLFLLLVIGVLVLGGLHLLIEGHLPDVKLILFGGALVLVISGASLDS